MHEHGGNLPSGRHSLADWLVLHDLNPLACRQILAAMPREVATARVEWKRSPVERRARDPEAAWLRTADAMRTFFPAQRSTIDDTLQGTVRVILDEPIKTRRALTLDNGPTAYPTVIYSYRSQPADYLMIAHEFAHALQIRASRGKFVPPIVREICAFLGENALLCHWVHSHAEQYRSIRQVWNDHNQRFFGTYRAQLEVALSQPNTSYSYTWNYPIARYLAIKTSQLYSPDWLWTLFEGELTVPGILRELSSYPGQSPR
jgi:hypothetical protein